MKPMTWEMTPGKSVPGTLGALQRYTRQERFISRSFPPFSGAAPQAEFALFSGGHRRPLDEFERPIVILGNGGATLHPVSGIYVVNAQSVMHSGEVDMPANDAVHPGLARFVHQRFLEAADDRDRVLDLLLGPGAERPILQAKAPSHPIDGNIDAQSQV